MTVVAGIDESPSAQLIVSRAADEARWRGAELHVVYVAHTPIVYTEVPIDWTEVAEAQRTAVWDGVESVLDQVEVTVKRVDIDGYPPDALVEYAKSVDANLLVVGTRGRGEFASLILGSTSHRALHLSSCDVLVVKPELSD